MRVDSRRPPCARWLVALALVLVATSARAEDKAAAKERYAHARSLYDLGHYAEAAKEFEAAYELKNDPAFLYDLAQSYRLAGDAEQALHFYRTYLRYVPKPANLDEINAQIAALEQQLAQKNVPPPQAPAPGSGAAATPPPPPPAIAPSTPPPSAPQPTAGAAASETSNVFVETAPPPIIPSPQPVMPIADRGRPFRIAGITTAGVGAFMVLIGIIEYGRAKSASDEVESEAKTGVAFDPNVQRRGQAAESAEAWLLTLGLLGGAGGAALWYYGHRLGAPAEGTTYRISFAPALSPGGGGAWLKVRF